MRMTLARSGRRVVVAVVVAVVAAAPKRAAVAVGAGPRRHHRPPTRSPIIGSTSAATAVELAGDLLVLQRHDQPGVEVEVGIGWMSQDGQRIIVIGFVRDGDLGQTYAVVRREGDGQVVRRWIAPGSNLVYAVPWDIVNTQYTFPVGVILAIPLDDQYPWPNMLTRRFDGGDDRILAYDAELGAVAARAGPGDVPGAGVLLVQRDGGGRRLLLADHPGPTLPNQQHTGPIRLPRLPDVTASPRRPTP